MDDDMLGWWEYDGSRFLLSAAPDGGIEATWANGSPAVVGLIFKPGARRVSGPDPRSRADSDPEVA